MSDFARGPWIEIYKVGSLYYPQEVGPRMGPVD